MRRISFILGLLGFTLQALLAWNGACLSAGAGPSRAAMVEHHHEHPSGAPAGPVSHHQGIDQSHCVCGILGQQIAGRVVATVRLQVESVPASTPRWVEIPRTVPVAIPFHVLPQPTAPPILA